MNNSISIRPSSELRNQYAQISKLSRQNPVAITVNGREDTVIMSHEDYTALQHRMSELEEKVALYAHLAQSADDIRLGRVTDAYAAFDDILKELDGSETV